MAYEFLQLAMEDGMATVTLNRPDVLNALNAAMLRELDELFAALQADAEVRVVLLRGAGDRAFAAGADIREFAALDAAAGEQMAARVQRIFRRIETLGKPVIACIQGYAVGGGCELALACTLRLAADNARLGQPEIKLGIIPGYGGSQRLPRLVGAGAALKMILTGEPIDAAEAWRIGLVDEVVVAAELMVRANELATRIAAMPPLAVTAALEAVSQGADLPLDQALALETAIFGRLCGTEDQREGTRAFLEKRAPTWTGR
ncbi:MAG TPA: enoyl-CoA hydratase-related protein [Acidobacteriaceae bacterium]|nr:enoyl-CoA hydratase-related protein [Acidobacteriaceae bacterium]